MPRIGSSTHGESRLRMLRIVRRGDRHDPRELTVSFRFDGDFADAFREGRARGLVPGEALKNIVHGVARENGGGEIEAFGLALCDAVLSSHRAVTRARVEVAEQPWLRLEAGGKPQGQAFMAGPPERRVTAVTSNGTQTSVTSGIEQVPVMRTSGFLPARDAAEEPTMDGLQRLLVGMLSVRWSYSTPDVTFGPYRHGIRAAILETFALHARHSVQHTLYAMADVVLASYQEITDVSLTFNERPYRPADLFAAGVENPDELFVAAEEPVGIVELTVER